MLMNVYEADNDVFDDPKTYNKWHINNPLFGLHWINYVTYVNKKHIKYIVLFAIVIKCLLH